MVATSHRKLQDTPTLEVVQNLQKLCVLVLQPLRDTIGAPVYINSGYRSKRLNARVGGVPNSRHLQGKAADIHCDNLDYAKVIFDILRQNKYVAYTYIGRASPRSSVANEGFAPLCGAAATPVAALKSSVANEGFAPLCGAAATPVAALKTPVAPVASREGGGICWVHVQM